MLIDHTYLTLLKINGRCYEMLLIIRTWSVLIGASYREPYSRKDGLNDSLRILTIPEVNRLDDQFNIQLNQLHIKWIDRFGMILYQTMVKSMEARQE